MATDTWVSSAFGGYKYGTINPFKAYSSDGMVWHAKSPPSDFKTAEVKAIYSGDLASFGEEGVDYNSSTIAANVITSALQQIGGVVEGRAWFTQAFLHAAQGRDVSGFGEVKRIYNTIFDILVPMFYDACGTERQSLEAMGLGLEKYKMRVAARLYSHARHTW